MSFKELLVFSLAVLIIASCSKQGHQEPAADAETLFIDGSSTVYPITEGIVDKYKSDTNNFIISLKVSGTGGGFDKFSKKEIDINNASREIKESEIEKCRANGVNFKRFDVAYDGIAVVVNVNNDFVDYLTVEELNLIWKIDGAETWSDVRPEWPDEEIKLFGPGDDSGTHDYFNDAIVGDDGMKDDYIKSENDNLLVRGIVNNDYAMGFFGLAYFEENKESLKIVPIDNGNGPVTPSTESVNSGQYTPLSRTMYIYVNEDFCNSESGKTFIKYYLSNATEVITQVGYVPLPASRYSEAINSL
jgi:phosphate transport system substrate-binding protein